MIILYILLFITSLLFYILYEGQISCIIFIFMCILPILLFIILKAAKRRIKVLITSDGRRHNVNEPIPVYVKISNSSVFPISICEITLEFYVTSSSKPEKLKINTPIFPMNTQEHTLYFYSEHFGTAECRIAKIKLFDILKIFRTKLKSKNIIQSFEPVLIIPDSLKLSNDISDYSELGLESDIYSDEKPGDDPSEIFSVHEYHDGDRISKIHWKLTAKEDKLIVKDYSLPLADSFIIAVESCTDCDPDEAACIYDTVIQTAVSLSDHLISENKRHKIKIYNEKEKITEEISVYDDESLINCCSQILLAGRAADPYATLEHMLNCENDNHKFGHMLYVSACFDEEKAARLETSGIAYRYTVLLCTSKISTLQNGLTKFSETDIIPVQYKRIEQSLSELIL